MQYLSRTCPDPVLALRTDLSKRGEKGRLMGGTPREKPEKLQGNAMAEAMENAAPNAVGFTRR